mmetsp:Transcript_107895/g.310899  ORF Transcript_107895/g.310899 Transcript_107895/m.310899 type:complete len:309 (-) Transcript_107895:1257-2183(-)
MRGLREFGTRVRRGSGRARASMNSMSGAMSPLANSSARGRRCRCGSCHGRQGLHLEGRRRRPIWSERTSSGQGLPELARMRQTEQLGDDALGAVPVEAELLRRATLGGSAAGVIFQLEIHGRLRQKLLDGSDILALGGNVHSGVALGIDSVQQLRASLARLDQEANALGLCTHGGQVQGSVAQLIPGSRADVCTFVNEKAHAVHLSAHRCKVQRSPSVWTISVDVQHELRTLQEVLQAIVLTVGDGAVQVGAWLHPMRIGKVHRDIDDAASQHEHEPLPVLGEVLRQLDILYSATGVRREHVPAWDHA